MCCGEDGWAYFTAVIDCQDRSILGWCFPPRCRALNVEQAMTTAVHTAFSYAFSYAEHLVDLDDGEPVVRVVMRHDNGTQFTAHRYRDTARTLGVKLSRSAYRHPDGNAIIGRLYRTLKEERVWPNDFTSFDEALAATTAWVIDYNTERPHDSLGITIWQPDLNRRGGRYDLEHRHSDIGFHTPVSVYFGTAPEIRAHRAVVLDAAYNAHPERFVAGRPQPPQLPDVVYTNPPEEAIATHE